MKPTRVVVADPHAIFRSGARSVIAREPGFAVIEAANLSELLSAADERSPDIVILDAELPPFGAASAVSRLKQRCSAEIVVWAFQPAQEEVVVAIRAGASGYLHKDISPGGLVRALRSIANGEAPISRDLVTALVVSIHALKQRESARDRAALLSDREREVVALVAVGARNKQIASALFISELTVKRHLQNIRQKLGLSSRQAAAEFYRDAVRSDALR